jgi:hypothetical protein
LHDQYRILSELIKKELKDSENGDDLILEHLQSVNLQKLVYGPYINGDILNRESVEKAFTIIDNEENWNRRLDGINKFNLGLTGLAGTGLLLLNAVATTRNPELFAPCPQP